SQRSLVLNVNNAEQEWLPIPGDYRDSVACDVSADGKVVTGYVIGRDPPRMLPCVWEKSATGWRAAVLVTPYLENPLLTTASVVVSNDGKLIAVSLVESRVDDLPRYALYVYRRQADGDPEEENRAADAAQQRWTAELVLPQAVHLAGVTDDGQIVGRILERNRRVAVLVSATEKTVQQILPEGYTNSRATGINRQAIVVGVADNGRMGMGETRAFAWRDGKFLDLPFPADVTSSVINCISAEGRMAGMIERTIESSTAEPTYVNSAVIIEAPTESANSNPQ
ncbi:MAG: hypothetical protein KDB23_33040, partial [Planctomycetales bacterium]|nr:hypothetical protein [Planctomycetales bacterium]